MEFGKGLLGRPRCEACLVLGTCSPWKRPCQTGRCVWGNPANCWTPDTICLQGAGLLKQSTSWFLLRGDWPIGKDKLCWWLQADCSPTPGLLQRYIQRLQQLLNMQSQPSDAHRAALLSVIQARVRITPQLSTLLTSSKWEITDGSARCSSISTQAAMFPVFVYILL